MKFAAHPSAIMLDPGETPAAGVFAFTPAQRNALTLALDGDRLDWHGRRGWRHPRGSGPVATSTIRVLVRDGLLVVVTRSRFNRHARLTRLGHWYARTLMSDAVARIEAIRAADRRAAANLSTSGDATP